MSSFERLKVIDYINRYWLYKQYWLYEPFVSSIPFLCQISAQGELWNFPLKISVELVNKFRSCRQICSNSLKKPLERNFILYAIMFLMGNNRSTAVTESGSMMIQNLLLNFAVKTFNLEVFWYFSIDFDILLFSKRVAELVAHRYSRKFHKFKEKYLWWRLFQLIFRLFIGCFTQ